MEIIVHIVIQSGNRDNPYHYKTMRKVYETDLVPMKDMVLADGVWDEHGKTIDKVFLIPDEDSYFIQVEPEYQPDESQCETVIKTYITHGWKDAAER